MEKGFVDHYQILRVGLSAPRSEIKKSYMLLSLSFHPDKNNDPGARWTFESIHASWKVLGNPEKRAMYDKERKAVLGDQEWDFSASDSDTETENSDSKSEEKAANDFVKVLDSDPKEKASEDSAKKISDLPPQSTVDKIIDSAASFEEFFLKITTENDFDTSKHSSSNQRFILKSAGFINPKNSVAHQGYVRRRHPKQQQGLYTIWEEDTDTESKYVIHQSSSMPGYASSKYTKPSPRNNNRGPWPSHAYSSPSVTKGVPLTRRQQLQHWKQTELVARDARIQTWEKTLSEAKGQVILLGQSAKEAKQKSSLYRAKQTTEELMFMQRMKKPGFVYTAKKLAALERKMKSQDWHIFYQLEIMNANNSYADSKVLIRQTMSTLNEASEQFEKTEKDAIARNVRYALKMLKAGFFNSQDADNTEQSQAEWSRLLGIGVLQYPVFNLPQETIHACTTSWSHRVKQTNQRSESERDCRRCLETLNFRTYRCLHCQALVCGLCKDKTARLQRYHHWLEDTSSDRLYGV